MSSITPIWFPLGLWIDGNWKKESDGKLKVENPGNGEVVAEVPLGGGPEAAAAVEAAKEAFGHWRRVSIEERSKILRRLYRLLVENRERLALLKTLEQGTPLAQSRGEVDFAAGYFRWFSEEARRVYGRTIPHPDPSRKLRVEYFPVGVAAAITPWNAPISAPARKISAALAAGCTMILKPSELTPLSALALAAIGDQAGLPPGVLNVVFGDAPAIGKVFLENPDVALISFTGSVATGKYLMSEAGKQIKRVSLELGGNAPFIVCSDARLEVAADELLALKCNNSGQVCISANRVFVEREVREPFLAALCERLDRQRLGEGTHPDTTLGPLIGVHAAEKISSIVREAVAEGAEAVRGGVWPINDLPKTFYPLTLLDHVTPEMKISSTEIFGPVIPVTVFDRDEDVISWANDAPVGLAAYVYTSNLDRAYRFAEGLEVGVVGINDLRPITPEAPFGGVKQSGIGREGGVEGLLEFLEERLIGVRIR